MYTTQATINGKRYQIGHAPATKQLKLVTLVSQRLMMVSANGVELDAKSVRGSLMMFDETTLNQVAEILLYQVVQIGAEVPTTVEDFQSKMSDFFTLLAEALVGNLGDFINELNEEVRSAKAKVQLGSRTNTTSTGTSAT